MAKKTTGDLLVERLEAWGVDTIFGLPGDGINGVMEALRKKKDKIRFVHVRHEEAAAFAACGYAKFSGKLGVCLATSGPGAIHLLNGLYDAKLDQVPVLAITGMTYHDLIGTHYQQDVNTDYLFQDVAVYNQRVMGATHVTPLADLAIRTALMQRGVAHLTFPIDVQEETLEDDERSQRNIKGHTSHEWQPPHTPAAQADIEQAASLLRGKKRIVILAGNGARAACGQLEALAERLAAPIIKPLLGKDVVPDESPYCLGGIGLLGTRPASEALKECDALLMVGTSFPYVEYLPKPGQAVGIQIEIDGNRVGLRYPVDLGLVGDAGTIVGQLLPLLTENSDRAFLEKHQAGMKDWWALMEERGTRDDKPMKPQVVSWNLGKLLPDNAIITSDSGTIATWAARQIPIRRGQRFSLSGNLATMANGFPYALGAQVAFPDRPCVAFVGDGGLEMLMAELATCVQENLPVKVVVIKNNVLGMIKWEQMVFLGNPEYGVDLSPIDFVKVAEACGARGVHIEDPGTCRQQLEEALAMEGPVLIEAVVDPYEAPMPPMVKPKQAKLMTEALAKGEPNRERIALTLFRDVIEEAGYSTSPSGLPGRIREAVTDALGQDEESKKS
ncbi:MAG TPA: thiamine pyrophosphate-dependent enzyme [Chloroflexota bacterium]|jgi:pyruvate dehydrogenase (quinone)/pyruvate oxidase|nr:thiamine pyrophosphate-dependent enzyme [Chloroflexota bacterium]